MLIICQIAPAFKFRNEFKKIQLNTTNIIFKISKVSKVDLKTLKSGKNSNESNKT